LDAIHQWRLPRIVQAHVALDIRDYEREANQPTET
jgi:hypothetical protein